MHELIFFNFFENLSRYGEAEIFGPYVFSKKFTF